MKYPDSMPTLFPRSHNWRPIGRLIRIARADADLSRAELARRIGDTGKHAHQNVADWETGKRIPKEETLKLIAKALGVDYRKLLPRL